MGLERSLVLRRMQGTILFPPFVGNYERQTQDQGNRNQQRSIQP